MSRYMPKAELTTFFASLLNDYDLDISNEEDSELFKVGSDVSEAVDYAKSTDIFLVSLFKGKEYIGQMSFVSEWSDKHNGSVSEIYDHSDNDAIKAIVKQAEEI